MEVREQKGDQDLKFSFPAHAAGHIIRPKNTGSRLGLGILSS